MTENKPSLIAIVSTNPHLAKVFGHALADHNGYLLADVSSGATASSAWWSLIHNQRVQKLSEATSKTPVVILGVKNHEDADTITKAGGLVVRINSSHHSADVDTTEIENINARIEIGGDNGKDELMYLASHLV